MTCFSWFFSPQTPRISHLRLGVTFPVCMYGKVKVWHLLTFRMNGCRRPRALRQQKKHPSKSCHHLPPPKPCYKLWIQPFDSDLFLLRRYYFSTPQKKTSIGNPNSMIPGASIHLGHDKVWKFGCLKHVIVIPSSPHPMPQVVKSSSAPIFSEMYFWAFEKEG